MTLVRAIIAFVDAACWAAVLEAVSRTQETTATEDHQRETAIAARDAARETLTRVAAMERRDV